MPHRHPEAIEAGTDIQLETTGIDPWISSNPSSQALLMASKKQDRLGKSKVFNGFVLVQNSKTDNEFIEFLKLLKQNASNIPPNTRVSLDVLTKYVDKRDDADFYAQNYRQCAHWTSIDLLIDEHGHVSSFVLDAANSFGYRGMHAALKKYFPEGDHYVFKADTIVMNGVAKLRLIQTQNTGCRVFVSEHAKQLSQIDTETLYQKELPALADAAKVVRPSSFDKPGIKLSRIFRGMQSWSILRSFSGEVQSTSVSESKEETLLQSALKRSVISPSGTQINNTVVTKNERYKAKKREYFESITPAMQDRIMEHRQGFTFLRNPILFKLSHFLSTEDVGDAATFVNDFATQLMRINYLEKDYLEKVDTFLKEINMLIQEGRSVEAIKTNVLFGISSLFSHLENHNRSTDIKTLTGIIDTITQVSDQRLLSMLSFDTTLDAFITEARVMRKRFRSDHVAITRLEEFSAALAQAKQQFLFDHDRNLFKQACITAIREVKPHVEQYSDLRLKIQNFSAHLLTIGLPLLGAYLAYRYHRKSPEETFNFQFFKPKALHMVEQLKKTTGPANDDHNSEDNSETPDIPKAT